MALPWIIITILVLLIIVAIVGILVNKDKKGKKKGTDYYSLFTMGAIWVPFGVIIHVYESESFLGGLFFILGWIYLMLGLAHVDEWKKDRRFFPTKNSSRAWLMWLLLGLLILGILVSFYFSRVAG